MRLYSQISIDIEQIISIHAPVKGATPVAAPVDVLAVISIHAPVKGATVS